MAQMFTAGKFSERDASGAPYSGGKLYTYAAGTLTPLATYTDAGGLTPNANPVILDSAGRADVFTGTSAYRMIFKTSADTTVWDEDNIVGNIATNILASLADTVSPNNGDALVGVKKTASSVVARTQHGVNNDTITVYDFLPAGFNTANDATSYIQACLNSGYATCDFLGLPLKCDSVTVPANVSAVHVNFTKYTAAAGNVVLVNNGSQVQGKIAGTGNTNMIQRCIYVAADGVSDVVLDVEVSGATVGVHAQPTSVTNPARWRGRVYAHDIVGAAGISEGYGVLLSPAEACQLVVEAKTIARHAVYLSAGAVHNDITATVDGCNNFAVQIFSTSAQAACQYNTVRVKARNLGDNTGTSGACGIVQKSHYNNVIVDCQGNGATQFAVSVEGSSGGPYPYGNKVVDGSITGQYTGSGAIRLLNADSTFVARNTVDAYGTVEVISSRATGTNGSTHAGYIFDNKINAQAQSVFGIYVEVTTVPTLVGTNDIRNNGASLRVKDNTGGKRTGYSRKVYFSGTTGTINSGTTGTDVVATLTDNLQVANRNGQINISGGSVSTVDKIVNANIVAAAAETTLTFRAYNSGSNQTLTYTGWCEGD